MRCIWTTSLELTWGVLQLRMIVKNMHEWVQDVVRPEVRSWLGKVRKTLLTRRILTPSGDSTTSTRRAVSEDPPRIPSISVSPAPPRRSPQTRGTPKFTREETVPNQNGQNNSAWSRERGRSVGLQTAGFPFGRGQDHHAARSLFQGTQGQSEIQKDSFFEEILRQKESQMKEHDAARSFDSPRKSIEKYYHVDDGTTLVEGTDSLASDSHDEDADSEEDANSEEDASSEEDLASEADANSEEDDNSEEDLVSEADIISEGDAGSNVGAIRNQKADRGKIADDDGDTDSNDSTNDDDDTGSVKSSDSDDIIDIDSGEDVDSGEVIYSRDDMYSDDGTDSDMYSIHGTTRLPLWKVRAIKRIRARAHLY